MPQISRQKMSTNHPAKFAFYYLLSLVGLLFVSLSTGMVIFQIINKYVVDILEGSRFAYSNGALRFALSALIVATPVYYFTTYKIFQALSRGELSFSSGIRKWLTYFILFVSSVVMIGWFIAIVNVFFEGDLTLKFVLKFLTAVGIAGIVFSFYLYDIRREEKKGQKIIKIYFWVTLLIVLISFGAGLFLVESPWQARARKIDAKVVNNLEKIYGALNDYYDSYSKLPSRLDDLKKEFSYLQDKDFYNIRTGKRIEYKVIDKNSFELCTDFLTSNKEIAEREYVYYGNRWLHDKGYQCLRQKVRSYKPVPLPEHKD